MAGYEQGKIRQQRLHLFIPIGITAGGFDAQEAGHGLLQAQELIWRQNPFGMRRVVENQADFAGTF
jgi:hypothetical protein